MAIPKTSKNKDAAWEYMKYISSYDIEKRKSIEIGTLPIWTELYNDQELLAIYPHWVYFGDLLLTARGLPDVVWIDEFADVCERETQNIMLGNVSVDQGLKAMSDAVDAISK
jgi:multiple sugar transport system substrate-binding protein